jgi:hypothetical protein
MNDVRQRRLSWTSPSCTCSAFLQPGIARFITEDSSKGSTSDPLSLNRYVYVEDNPEKYVDPSGNRFAVAGLIIESTNVQAAVQQINQIQEQNAQAAAYERAHPPPPQDPSQSQNGQPLSCPVTAPAKMGMGAYLVHYFYSHITDLATDVVDVVLASSGSYLSRRTWIFICPGNCECCSFDRFRRLQPHKRYSIE